MCRSKLVKSHPVSCVFALYSVCRNCRNNSFRKNKKKTEENEIHATKLANLEGCVPVIVLWHIVAGPLLRLVFTCKKTNQIQHKHHIKTLLKHCLKHFGGVVIALISLSWKLRNISSVPSKFKLGFLLFSGLSCVCQSGYKTVTTDKASISCEKCLPNKPVRIVFHFYFVFVLFFNLM